MLIILLYSSLFELGYTTSTPVPTTAIVLRLLSIAYLCARVSIPYARPDIIVSFESLRSAQSFAVTFLP